MKARLEAMAAEWRERGHRLQRMWGKEAPMQVAAAQGALEACAEELEKAVKSEDCRVQSEGPERTLENGS